MLLHNIYESALLGLCALQWFCYLTVETSTKTQKKDTTFEKVITVSDSGLTAYWEKSLHHPWPKMSTLIEVDLTRIMMFSFFFFSAMNIQLHRHRIRSMYVHLLIALSIH